MKYFISLIIISLLLSCSVQKIQSPEKKQTSLENTNWVLQSDVIQSFVEGKQIELQFQGNKASGFSGCNTFIYNTVEIEGNTIDFGSAAITKRSCPNIADEQLFHNLLQEANTFQLTENSIQFYKNKLLLLTFSRKQQ